MAALPPATSATVEAIYTSYERARAGEHRPHLGASLIGHDCDRFLWLTFRHAMAPKFSGRMLRLFETGNLAAPRFVADLRAIGCEVSEEQEPGKQWRETAVDGHFGSAIDGAVLGLPEAPKTWHLVEMKTHNAKSFSLLVSKGVREAKPQHYAQMVVGMELHGFTRALYLAVNKDNDELYSERIKADPIEAARLLERARRIVYAEKPPERIGGPDWFQCKFCHFYPICHERQFPERNCRTCVHSTPVSGCRWECTIHGDIRKDCPDHQYIPELVPGKQVDVRDGRVVYEMHGGVEWVDGGDPHAALEEASQ